MQDLLPSDAKRHGLNPTISTSQTKETRSLAPGGLLGPCPSKRRPRVSVVALGSRLCFRDFAAHQVFLTCQVVSGVHGLSHFGCGFSTKEFLRMFLRLVFSFRRWVPPGLGALSPDGLRFRAHISTGHIRSMMDFSLSPTIQDG